MLSDIILFMGVLLQYFGIVVDIFVLSSIIYVLVSLAKAKHYTKEEQKIDISRRETTYRNSFLLLAIYIFLGLVQNNFLIFAIEQELSKDISFMMMKLALFGFGMMIIKTTNVTNIKKKSKFFEVS